MTTILKHASVLTTHRQMFPHWPRCLLLLLFPAFATMVSGAEPGSDDVLERIQKYINPLAHPLADRLPVLTWQSRGFPTGLEDGRVEQVQQFFMDRGLSRMALLTALGADLRLTGCVVFRKNAPVG